MTAAPLPSSFRSLARAQAAIERAPIHIYPYQEKWINDPSRLKAVVKSTQIGYSWATALGAVRDCSVRRTDYVFLSRSQRQSLILGDKVKMHIQALQIACKVHDQGFFEGTLIKRQELVFPNGSHIYLLPANPETARGYTGNVVLDEFAFHKDQAKIYTALYGRITQAGFGLSVISTPNGSGDEFEAVAKKAGIDGSGSPADEGSWSGHRTTLIDAIAQGFHADMRTIRAGCLDDDMFLQEYMCSFVASGTSWISPELMTAATDDAATLELPPSASNLVVGWDIARNRDLSVLWCSELVGDVTWTRAVIVFANVPTPDQIKEARALMPSVKRLTIDKSGMGLVIFETLEREFPGRVEGVQFTQGAKESLAVYGKTRMQEQKTRLPDDPTIRMSFRSVRRTTTSVGLMRFDAAHDAQYGHADHWWAYCLAEAAAQGSQSMYSYATDGSGGAIGEPIAAGLMTKVL